MIPRLSADEICKHTMLNYRGQRCLTGHVIELGSHKSCIDLYNKLLEFINRKFGRRYKFICEFNDNSDSEVCANTWNECFHGS